MKYIEELKPSDCFIINNEIFLISADYKKSGDRICISTKTGFMRNFSSNYMVDQIYLYTLDKENNIIPIHPIEKEK